MNIKDSFIILAVLLLLGGLVWASDVDMDEGEWETTMEIKMEGMTFSIPPVKTTQCLTKKDLVPRTSEKGKEGGCKNIYTKVTGNTVSFKTECVDDGVKTVSEGKITYSGSSYSGSVKIVTTEADEEPMTSTAKFTGRRIGDCKGGQEDGEGAGMEGMPEGIKAQIAEAQKEASLKEAEQAEIRKRYAGLVKEAHAFNPRIKEKGACTLKDLNTPSSSECDQKLGKIKLSEGKWEIVQEGVTEMLKMKPPYDITEKKRDTYEECLDENDFTPSRVPDMCVQDIKRTGDRIVWKIKCPTQKGGDFVQDGDGEIVYSGNTLKGMTVMNTKDKGVHQMSDITRITGRRIDECFNRDYTSTGRDYTSQKRDSGTDKTKEIFKGIKGIFGR